MQNLFFTCLFYLLFLAPVQAAGPRHVEVGSANASVVINELMASNMTTATDEAGEYDDWIELFNPGGQAVDLSGWFISDNPANLDKWDFPAGTVLQPGAYLILWADEDSSQGPFHLNFKLSVTGEQVILLDAASTVVDQVTFGAQDVDQSLARIPNGTGNFIVKNPTFGYNNEQASGTSNQNELLAGFELLPNPADQQVSVALPDNYSGSVEVFDMLGQILVAEPYYPGFYFSTRQWPAGVYAVHCGGATKVLVVKH